MELVNEKLNMWSCKLGELTYKQIGLIRSTLGEDSLLSQFESFFDDETGKFLLNREYPNYELVVKNYTTYLQANEHERTKMRENYTYNEFLSELMDYLDIIALKKQQYELRHLAELQRMGNALDVYNAVNRRNMPPLYTAIQMYNLGIIQGKRHERAKRNNQGGKIR